MKRDCSVCRKPVAVNQASGRAELHSFNRKRCGGSGLPFPRRERQPNMLTMLALAAEGVATRHELAGRACCAATAREIADLAQARSGTTNGEGR